VSHTETVYKQDTVLTNYTIVIPLSVTVALCKKNGVRVTVRVRIRVSVT